MSSDTLSHFWYTCIQLGLMEFCRFLIWINVFMQRGSRSPYNSDGANSYVAAYSVIILFKSKAAAERLTDSSYFIHYPADTRHWFNVLCLGKVSVTNDKNNTEIYKKIEISTFWSFHEDAIFDFRFRHCCLYICMICVVVMLLFMPQGTLCLLR